MLGWRIGFRGWETMILYLSYERVGVNAEYRRLKRGDEGGTYVVQRRDLEGALSDLFVLAPLC